MSAPYPHPHQHPAAMGHPHHPPPIMPYPMAGYPHPHPPPHYMPYGPTPPMPPLGPPPAAVPPANSAAGEKKEADKKPSPTGEDKKEGEKKEGETEAQKEGEEKSDDKKEEDETEDGDAKKQQGLDLLASLAMPVKKPGDKKADDAKVAAPEGDGAAATKKQAEAAGIKIVQMDGPTTSKKPRKKSRVEEMAPKEKLFVEKVRDVDVLCGRGGKSNHHPGNKRYRQVVSEMKRTYQSTGAKTAKTDLSRAIVEHVVGYGGRFIKRDEATGQYFLLTKAQARRKTSQALRETKELKWTM